MVYLRVWYNRVYLRVWYNRVYLRVVYIPRCTSGWCTYLGVPQGVDNSGVYLRVLITVVYTSGCITVNNRIYLRVCNGE